MNSNTTRRRFPRGFAGTVLIGSLAFAAQVQAQQSGGQGQRPDRGADQRGPGGRGGRGDPAQMVDRRVTMLTERLGLSTTQAASIRGILLDEQTQMEALRPQGGAGQRGSRTDSAGRGQRTRADSASRAAARAARPDSAAREQARAQMDALHQRTDARIESVLSAEQRTAYGELVKSREGRPEGGPGRGGPGRGGLGGRGGPGRGGQQPPPPPAA